MYMQLTYPHTPGISIFLFTCGKEQENAQQGYAFVAVTVTPQLAIFCP